MKIRYLSAQIKKDLEKKMVFVAGPRQVGKTTLAKNFLSNESGYLNWDIPPHRKKILTWELPDTPLLIFDEIHKYRGWRNFLKGVYDDRKGRQKILVTGSARLDLYRYGGDSLQGRYHHLHLFPLSVNELQIKSQKDFLSLLDLSGFPEPFLGGSKQEAERWSTEYRSLVLREEITDLERIHDLGQMELLMLRLPDLVGSPLSINSLREDLQTSHKTLSRWVKILEKLYSLIRIYPFGAPKIRAVKKESKHYHFDWSVVSDPAARFENLVAIHLAKWVQFEVDTKGRPLELRYFRDVDGREVDFVVTEKSKPILFIECKWNDRDIDPSLNYLKTRFPDCTAWQISALGTKDYVKNKIHVSPALLFLDSLI